jgi:hypothetical protein
MGKAVESLCALAHQRLPFMRVVERQGSRPKSQRLSGRNGGHGGLRGSALAQLPDPLRDFAGLAAEFHQDYSGDVGPMGAPRSTTALMPMPWNFAASLSSVTAAIRFKLG